VRGDEVVSLGWCFWHRACFGCLVCGDRMDLEPLQSGHLSNGGCGKTKRKRKRMIGVELEMVPLCAHCNVEMEGKGKGAIVEQDLETVSKLDGGLSRDRIDMLSEGIRKQGQSRKPVG
jgi:hypothetical protein